MSAAAQPFERHPALALWIERLANCTIEGMSLADWGDFLEALNDALSSSPLIVSGETE